MKNKGNYSYSLFNVDHLSNSCSLVLNNTIKYMNIEQYQIYI